MEVLYIVPALTRPHARRRKKGTKNICQLFNPGVQKKKWWTFDSNQTSKNFSDFDRELSETQLRSLITIVAALSVISSCYIYRQHDVRESEGLVRGEGTCFDSLARWVSTLGLVPKPPRD